jgi:type IX secretion system PorP/SprF family membrane protein
VQVRKKMRPTILLTIASFLIVPIVHSQDVGFSQFYEAAAWRNPAVTGFFKGDLQITGQYRSQWGSVTLPYKTGALSTHYKMHIGQGDDFVTAGINLLYDKVGVTNFTTTHIIPSINYHKALGGNRVQFLNLGFMAGVVQRTIDRTKMITNNQFDGNGYNPALADGEPFVNNQFIYGDGSAGISYYTELDENGNTALYAGFAYHHFNRPKNSFYKNPNVELNARWVLSAGFKANINESAYITFHTDWSVQGSFQQKVLGAMYSLKIGDYYDEPDYILHIGGFLRWADAFIPVVKLDYQPFSIGFSYDANVSQLKTASQGRGGAELSIGYTGFLNNRFTTKDYEIVPRW